jgi:hypothetical protein
MSRGRQELPALCPRRSHRNLSLEITYDHLLQGALRCSRRYIDSAFAIGLISDTLCIWANV